MDNTEATVINGTRQRALRLHELSGFKYGDLQKRVIQRFLAYSQMTLEQALRGVKATAGKDIGHCLFAGQITYLENAISCVKMLAWRTNKSQPHLRFVDDVPLERIGELWQLPFTTLEERTQSLLHAFDTIIREGSETDGPSSNDGPSANSVTVQPPPLKHLSETQSVQPNSPKELRGRKATVKSRARKNASYAGRPVIKKKKGGK